MCVSGCLEVVRNRLCRREFMVGASILAGSVACNRPGLATVQQPNTATRQRFPAFDHVVDMTYTYSSEFPHYGGRKSVVKKEINSTTDNSDWNVYTWTMDEHAGTHIDAPFHRNAKGDTVEKIPVSDLVLPLAVIDIKDRAKKNHSTRVTVDDIRNWEKKHGRLPDRCCVAMNSGWESRGFKDGKFINMDRSGVRHFPGFGIEASEFLFEKRSVVALASDTASIDFGPSKEYPTHVKWLGGNRYGLENVAALDKVPPVGATMVAGALKIAGATGGHSRVIALVSR